MAKARKHAAPKPSRPHMPGYGLPESKKGLLPWKWAEQRLRKSHNYWITTVKPDGSPHTMVIWGLWMEGAFPVQHGSAVAQGPESGEESALCGLHRAGGGSGRRRRRG